MLFTALLSIFLQHALCRPTGALIIYCFFIFLRALRVLCGNIVLLFVEAILPVNSRFKGAVIYKKQGNRVPSKGWDVLILGVY